AAIRAGLPPGPLQLPSTTSPTGRSPTPSWREAARASSMTAASTGAARASTASPDRARPRVAIGVLRAAMTTGVLASKELHLPGGDAAGDLGAGGLAAGRPRQGGGEPPPGPVGGGEQFVCPPA